LIKRAGVSKQALSKALASIEHTFQKRAAVSLLTGRGALLPTAAETPRSRGDDFDLVTWVVVKSA